MTSPDQGKSDSLPDMSTSCPPALRCLVFLWEQINANCIQVIQRNGFNLENEQNIKDSTLIDDQNASDFDARKGDIKKGKQSIFVFCSFMIFVVYLNVFHFNIMFTHR